MAILYSKYPRNATNFRHLFSFDTIARFFFTKTFSGPRNCEKFEATFVWPSWCSECHQGQHLWDEGLNKVQMSFSSLHIFACKEVLTQVKCPEVFSYPFIGKLTLKYVSIIAHFSYHIWFSNASTLHFCEGCIL